ncbi:MAG: hypothetical protein JOZ11_20765 [Alphaproteobacteria bacterium]|nr:hypothetical protein [Alphaproteobacteria bacterium]
MRHPTAPVLAATVSALALLLQSTTSSAGNAVLAVNEDEINGSLNVFYGSAAKPEQLYEMFFPEIPQPEGWKKVTGVAARPEPATLSAAVSFDDYVLGHPQVFYLAAGAQGAPAIELLWNTSLTPLDVTSQTHAQTPAMGTSLVGYDDECAATDNVFFVGSDRHVHHIYYKKNHGWFTEDLTRRSGAGPVEGLNLAGHEAQSSEEIFYLEADGHVHELWRWSGCPDAPGFDGWHHVDLVAASGGHAPRALAGSGLTSFFDPNTAVSSSGVYESSGTLDAVLYVDGQHHLQEIYLTSSSAWKDLDLTAQSGAAAVPAGSALASQAWLYQSDGFFAAFEDVYFIDAKAGIWEISSAFEGAQGQNNAGSPYKWTAVDASKAAKAPAAGVGTPMQLDINDILCPPGQCDSSGFRKEINYVGTDEHVHSLGEYMFDLTGWTVEDLSTFTGAPKARP